MKGDCFDEDKRARYLGLLRKGLRHCQACRACKVHRASVWNYTKNHPEFQEEIDRAEADYCDVVERYLLKNVKNLNVTAQIFWLTNRAPDKWKDRRNTPGNNAAAPDATTEALKQILDRLTKEKDGQP